MLLLYTDGGDSTSRMTFGQLQELLRLGNVMVYALGYLENQLSSLRAMPQQMRMNADRARDRRRGVLSDLDPRRLHEVYAKILDELGSRYTLGYVSTNAKRDGKFRKVEVKLEGARTCKSGQGPHALRLSDAPQVIRAGSAAGRISEPRTERRSIGLDPASQPVTVIHGWFGHVRPDPMPISDRFQLETDFELRGDQPQAIDQLAEGLRRGDKAQVLLGVTGSGKTFTMAQVAGRA